jgi:hypothetical protein
MATAFGMVLFLYWLHLNQVLRAFLFNLNVRNIIFRYNFINLPQNFIKVVVSPFSQGLLKLYFP